MLSFKENIPIILETVLSKNPMKIVDVGAGMGKYGLLLREQYLSFKTGKGELSPLDDITIDAIEDTKYFFEFRRGLLEVIYDSVFKSSVFDITDILFQNKYDMVLLIDTVEHWTKEEALGLIRKINKYSDILVSTPKKVSMYTKHYYGDPRHHITQWDDSDLNEFNIDIVPNKNSHIIYIHKSK
jgi:hypothetical protein